MHELWFNSHDVILLLTAALTVLLAIPMLLKPRSRVADRTLACFVLTQGCAAFYYLLVYSPAFGPTMLRWLGSFEMLPLVVIFLLQGPLLLRYSQAISGQPVRATSGDFWVFGMVLAMAVVDSTMMTIYGSRPSFPMIPMAPALPALVVSIVYGIRAIALLRRHDREIRQRFSNLEDINLLWLSYAAVGFTGVWLLRFSSLFAFDIGGQPAADAIGAAVNYPTVVLICWMITLGLSQAQSPSSRSASATAADREPVARKARPETVDKLEQLMTEVKVYQDPELNVEGLADSMGISPRSLSALINGHHGKNFYDFVNHYRVLETQQRLRDPGEQRTTIQRIFEDAGFNSKSTFNSFFKKVTGQTPSEFRRQTGSRRHRQRGSAWQERGQARPDSAPAEHPDRPSRSTTVRRAPHPDR